MTGTVEAAMRELLPQQRPSNNGKSSGRRQHLAQIVARLVATTVATLSDRASDIIQGAGRNLSEWRKSQHGRRERRDGDDPYRPTQGGTDLHSPEPAQPRYLFVCFTQHKKYEWTEMVPICMNVSTDKDLFVVLRCRYNAKVGIWRRILGLKRLTEFRFVQVRCKPKLITVRPTDRPTVPDNYSSTSRDPSALGDGRRPSGKGLPMLAASRLLLQTGPNQNVAACRQKHTDASVHVPNDL